MDDRTVTLHVDDWMRVKIALNQAGKLTPAIDELILGDEQRPSLTRSWEWWCALVGITGKVDKALTHRIITQASASLHRAPPPKPEQHEVEYARKYLAMDDDRELPEFETI